MSLSLIGGGPLHDLAARARLAGRGGRRVLSRVAAVWLLTWAPLLILSALEGAAVGDAVVVPFVEDLTAQVRFLIAVPVLVAAGAFTEPRLHDAVRHLERGGLIPDRERPALAHLLRRASQLSRSRVELLLLVPVVAAAAFSRRALVSQVSSWEYVDGRLAPAGLWLVTVSLPVYRYLALRWLWRCGIWAWVQLRVARMPLQLAPAHPDGACGLAFLGLAQTTLVAPLVLSLAALNAAFVGNRALYLGVPVADSMAGVAVFSACALGLAFAPLVVFTPRLAAAKRRGLLEYGALGQRLARGFEEAWTAPGAPPTAQLLARQDASSLADFMQVFEAVQRARLVPLDRAAVLMALLATLAPALPLLASQVPPEQALQVLRAVAL